jgi:superfamily II DNA or RNA helicase
MNWLHRKRQRIRSELADAALARLGRADNIPFASDVHEHSSKALSLGAHVMRNGRQALVIGATWRDTADPVISCLAHDELLPMSARRAESPLLMPLSVRCPIVPLSLAIESRSTGGTELTAFATRVSREGFMSHRPEKPGGSLFGPSAKRGPRVAPVKPLEKPPGRPPASLNDRLKWILTPPLHEELSDPTLGLPYPLYPYQVIGIGWLKDRDSALLADEMGLGKTVQAIVAARLLWRERTIDRILIVCPKSLVPNWARELRTWWPHIAFNFKIITEQAQWYLRLATDNMHVKIITYDRLARECEWLESQSFTHDLIIIDEAQRIKNPASKAARAVRALRAKRRWALTGTPIENAVSDVHSIFQFVKPGLLTSEEPASVRSRIRPFMLRRRTEEVLPELPERVEQVVEIELTPEQRTAYDEVESSGVSALNGIGDKVTVTHVFALIRKTMQLCNFEPSSGKSAKIDRLREDLEEVVASGRKALVFSQFVSEEFGLKRVKSELKDICRMIEMHGEVGEAARTRAVSEFMTRADSPVMLLNYRVGGVGLNLQAASYVFLFDRWWNPAVEDQAVKRAHRLGQSERVVVRRFVCENTIEERIVQKLEEKRRLFSHVIDENRLRPEDLGLSEEEVFRLFPGLKARPAKGAKSQSGKTSLFLGRLNPAEFEHLVGTMYERLGYTVRRTGASHDGGVDLWAERRSSPHQERLVVQCKHTEGVVGRPVAQQLWGVIQSDPSITEGAIVTSSRFSKEAQEFVEGKRLRLIGRGQLTKLLADAGIADVCDTNET